MQAELLSDDPATNLRIVGVNSAAAAGSNGDATEGRTIPWLQDPDDRVWTSWAPAYRDVVILDTQNRKVAVFNLTVHDLQKAEEYAALLALLRDTAGEEPPP